MEFVFDGLATFTARVEADNLLDAAAAIRGIQALNPDWQVEGEVTISEFSWGNNVDGELVFVHDEEDTLPGTVLDPHSNPATRKPDIDPRATLAASLLAWWDGLDEDERALTGVGASND